MFQMIFNHGEIITKIIVKKIQQFESFIADTQNIVIFGQIRPFYSLSTPTMDTPIYQNFFKNSIFPFKISKSH